MSNGIGRHGKLPKIDSLKLKYKNRSSRLIFDMFAKFEHSEPKAFKNPQ